MLVKAVLSGLVAQIELNKPVFVDDVKLSVKMRFGVGRVDIIYIGGIFDCCEYIAVGSPLI